MFKTVLLISLIIIIIISVIKFYLTNNFINEKFNNYDNILYFSLFIKNNKIYMISPIYNTPFKSKKLYIYNNNSDKLNLYKEHIKNEYEPIHILIFDSSLLTNNIKIIYNNIIFKTIVPKKFDLEYYGELAITTLFKYDYKLFNIFYDYYTKQGVSKFYMYYNGKLNNDIINLFNKPNVILLEWNFKYWNKNTKFKHHAQLGQMHDALFKYGKDNHNYMIFCDLDEYLYINNNTTLLKYINNNSNVNCFGFNNYFAKTLDEKIPNVLPKNFLIGKKFKYTNRSKNIYKTNTIDLLNIHHPKKFNISNPKSINNLYMFHFQSWSNRNNKNINNKIFINY